MIFDTPSPSSDTAQFMYHEPEIVDEETGSDQGAFVRLLNLFNENFLSFDSDDIRAASDDVISGVETENTSVSSVFWYDDVDMTSAGPCHVIRATGGNCTSGNLTSGDYDELNSSAHPNYPLWQVR